LYQFKARFLLVILFLVCTAGCGEEPNDFDETVIVKARLDNLELSWKGAGYGDISGHADLVVTDLQGDELTQSVNIFGGVFGAVAGGVQARNIFDDTDPIQADFFIPTLEENGLLAFDEVELSDGGIEQREINGLEDAVGDIADLIKAAELFGAYFGGQTGFAVLAGWDAQFLIKSPKITLALGHPTFGFGLAMGVEWLTLVR